MRALLLAAALSTLAPSASLAAPSPTLVPDEVKQGLAEGSIGVVDATDLTPSSLPVRSKQAFRVALKNFGWTVVPGRSSWIRVHRVTIHLVRLTEPSSRVDLHPLYVGDLAWLIVIRDATIPILGPPGGSCLAPLAVIVSTDQPRYVRAMSL